MAGRNATLAALRRRTVPAWWRDAKLGIFVHWTMAAVPAFAPVDVEFPSLVGSGRRDAFGWSPYVEWYENSLRFPDSPAAHHHRSAHGDAPYRSFRDAFEDGIAAWDPTAWAEAFAATGARYVVLVTKHHDGFCLWPTSVTHPTLPGWHSRRDVVGELAEAVRGAGMRFGLYYSGGLDWTFDDRPIGSMADLLAAVPRGAYPAYAEAQVRELVDRYRPSVLWNDIAWPQPGAQLWPLFAHYYDQVPDGVVNDRWMPWSPLLAAARNPAGRRLIDAVVDRMGRGGDGGVVPPAPPHFDVRTPEYTVFPDVQRTPWECVRGMDHSFGYNRASRPDDFVGRDELLWMLADIAAKGGNLLLNVGPRGEDGTIPEPQADRLAWLGAWIDAHPGALQDTRPWIRAGSDGPGGRVRYTCRGETVHALVDGDGGAVRLAEVRSTPTTRVTSVDGDDLPWHEGDGALVVEATRRPEVVAGPVVVVLEHVEARGA